MREYELWLDESGDFEPDSQTHKKRYPSMVGGVLIEKGRLSDNEIHRLANPDPGAGIPHAVDMKDKVESVILPALETLCARGGKLVYSRTANVSGASATANSTAASSPPDCSN